MKGETKYMGVESFYVKIKCNQLKELVNFLKYNKCLEYSFEHDYCCISGSLVCFFPAVEVVYNIINAIKERPISVISMDQEICYNFDTYIDFLNWMYKIWQDKINHFYKEYGAFIITPSSFYKAHRILRKKYFKKLNENIYV